MIWDQQLLLLLLPARIVEHESGSKLPIEVTGVHRGTCKLLPFLEVSPLLARVSAR